VKPGARPGNFTFNVRLLAALLLGAAAVEPRYVDGSPSLGKIIHDSTNIVVLQVDRVNADKRAILFKKVADLKGESAAGPVAHQLSDGWHPREPKFVLTWAESGKRAVFFSNGATALTCIGPYWYQSYASQGSWWTMLLGRPDLSYAYTGSAERLHGALGAILEGKEAVVTAVKHEEGRWGTYANVAFREVMRGKDNPVWRIRASLAMPPLTMNVSRDPRWVVGPGAAGLEEVPERVRSLKSREAGLRKEAAGDLGSIGPGAAAALPALREALKDPDAEVRIAAAAATLRIDASDVPALRHLEGELKAGSARVRRAAAQALGETGAALPSLRKALADPDADLRWVVAEAIGQFGTSAAAAVPDLVARLQDAPVRAAVLDALGRIGPAAKEAVPALLPVLRESSPLRFAAALALARIGGEGARAAVPHLLPGLKSGDEKSRWDATVILWTMGPDARDAVPALLESVRAGNDMAVDALAAVDRKAAVPVLVERRLKHGDPAFRRYAAEALGAAGPDAAEAVPALTELLNDPSEEVRAAAAEALRKIRKP
jgi:HEAT repeat protein